MAINAPPRTSRGVTSHSGGKDSILAKRFSKNGRQSPQKGKIEGDHFQGENEGQGVSESTESSKKGVRENVLNVRLRSQGKGQWRHKGAAVKIVSPTAWDGRAYEKETNNLHMSARPSVLIAAVSEDARKKGAVRFGKDTTMTSSLKSRRSKSR